MSHEKYGSLREQAGPETDQETSRFVYSLSTTNSQLNTGLLIQAMGLCEFASFSFNGIDPRSLLPGGLYNWYYLVPLW
jgi:hypothetical protein